jgi:hypothetical protein
MKRSDIHAADPPKLVKMELIMEFRQAAPDIRWVKLQTCIV